MPTDSNNWYEQLTSVFQPAPNSLADTLLAKVFGNWIFSPEEITQRHLQGGFTTWENWTGMADVTAISTILGYSGIFAAGLALLLASYAFVMTLVKGAWLGEFANRDMSSIWWPIRSIMAFSLIMPLVPIGANATVGVSQVWLVDLARKGSAGADTVAVAYLDATISNPITNMAPPSWDMAPAELTQMAICALTFKYYEPQNFKRLYTAYDESRRVIATVDDLTGNVSLPSNTKIVNFGENGRCGQVTFPSSVKANSM